jgi:glyoxylase-like metal-dependent hydrolase (beta-lactamase superfamily II)
MQISPEELKQKISDVFVLDVRTDEEFRDWHIDQAVHVPMQNVMMKAGELPKDKEIVTVCAHGNRSQMIAQFLTGAGFRVRSLQGGMAAWNNIYDEAKIADGFQVRRVGKGCVSYVVVSNGIAAVIDPSWHTQEYLNLAKSHNLTIKHVLDTHQHADHISGARMLAKAVNAKLYLNSLDSYNKTDFINLKDGDKIEVSDIVIEAVHTPGHTKGSMTFLVNDQLLTGDTLFVNGIARPDLKDRTDEYAADLFSTYQDKILNLKENLSVMPGHFTNIKLNFGEAISSTLKDVKKLPQLQLSRGEFISYIKSHLPEKPPNYGTIKRINAGELEFYEDEAGDLEEGPNMCTVR